MRARLYAVVCGVLGVAMIVLGLASFASFVGAHMPGAVPGPIGPHGLYFVAFTGCALVGWGGSLLGQVRAGQASRSVGTATVVALVMSALYRMMVWIVGDYYVWLGNLPLVESTLFLVLALALLWLRPERRTA